MILLTTMAVGFAVALVALGGFLTVRMQMQSSLDQSLLDRARQAATAAPLLDDGLDPGPVVGHSVPPTSASSS